jgi:RNA polymerase sigma-70 factor (ECF subfamily)
MFVCAHPEVPARMHAPLMLQVVLGLEAQTLANAFLVSPTAMAQRLVRAKAGIRSAGLRFELPEARELAPRLGTVLDGIYGAYTIGSDLAQAGPLADQGVSLAGLCHEALYLTEVVCALLPDAPEALGLRALLLYCEARRPAHFADDGRFVPLARQDSARWSRPLIEAAEVLLRRAARSKSPGSFQLEAAIQSAHCQRLFGGETPWREIAELYSALVVQNPGVGARIGQAVALAESGDPTAGLAVLDAIAPNQVVSHQPYWVVRAHLARLQGDRAAARVATDKALGLTMDPRIRAYLIATN